MPGMDSSFTGVPYLSRVNTFILTLNINKTLKDISGGNISYFGLLTRASKPQRIPSFSFSSATTVADRW